ncbi:hypothetical protein [uncultured Cocleimonas sp.]|uniref:hypothetical protein n=1 Tax=uncultured Cocleimonas sp. TaxID=1051587 RepID=UPI002612E448|nr:hypothetical protein [uncultured Cocleimonas sp.]
MKNTMKRILVGFILACASQTAIAENIPNLPLPSDEVFFYEIGAGTNFRVIGGKDVPKELQMIRDFGLLMGDGEFDPLETIKATLKGLLQSYVNAWTKKVKGMMNISQYTSSLIQLPGYTQCIANPTSCQITENYTVRSEERERYQREFLNKLEGELGNVRGQLDGWLQAGKANHLIKVMNEAKASGEQDIEKVTGKIRDYTGKEGLKWIGGEMAGGDGQPPIRPIADAAKAGFNMLLGRDATNGSKATGDDPLLDYWDTPEELGKWLTEVVGEYRPDLNNTHSQSTISGDKIGSDDGDLGRGGEDVSVTSAYMSSDMSTPSMGLSPKVRKEATLIRESIQAMVDSSTEPTTEELTQIMGKSSSIVLTPQLINILKNSPLETVLIKQLSDDAALANTIKVAIEARRALLAGRNENHIASYEMAKNDIDDRAKMLTQYIDDLLYERRISSELLTGRISSVYQHAESLKRHYGNATFKTPTDTLSEGGKSSSGGSE